jgi:hypothetical protein
MKDNMFEIIEENEVVFAKRGRKSNVDPEMVDSLKALPQGVRAAVRTLKCDPTTESYKTDKARVAAQIRSAAKVAGVAVTINWTVDGVPTVIVTNTPAVSARKSK